MPTVERSRHTAQNQARIVRRISNPYSVAGENVGESALALQQVTDAEFITYYVLVEVSQTAQNICCASASVPFHQYIQ